MDTIQNIRLQNLVGESGCIKKGSLAASFFPNIFSVLAAATAVLIRTEFFDGVELFFNVFKFVLVSLGRDDKRVAFVFHGYIKIFE